MSKAFTREDDAGLEPEKAPRTVHPPHTRMGQAQLVTELATAQKEGDLARAASLQTRLAAGSIPAPDDVSHAALGAEVTLRDARGRERLVRLVTADEVGLVPRGASPASPIGAAIAGARVGDEVEIDGKPLTVVQIAWP